MKVFVGNFRGRMAFELFPIMECLNAGGCPEVDGRLAWFLLECRVQERLVPVKWRYAGKVEKKSLRMLPA